ncbi:MAG: hypothetical protein KBF59_05505 [Ignavibacterium sp.]|nr:hypothetical protein [Ignavibacterium sp.]
MKQILLCCAYCITNMLCGQNDDLIGKTFVTQTSLTVTVYDQSKQKDTTKYVIQRDYKIKIYEKIIIDSKPYYAVKIFNYFYGNDKVIKDFEPEIGAVATVKTKIGNERYESIKGNSFTQKTLQQKMKSPEFTIDTNETLNIFNVKKEVNNTTGYLLSKSRIEDNIFLLDASEIIYCKEYIEKNEFLVNLSAMSAPFKVRFAKNNLDFTQKFSLGVSGDLKIRYGTRKDIFNGILIGVNVSGETVNENDFKFTNNVVQLSSSAFIISPSIAIYHQRSRIQMMFGMSVDFMEKNIAKAWVYNGRPNIIFGIGYDIIKPEKQNTDPEIKGLNASN